MGTQLKLNLYRPPMPFIDSYSQLAENLFLFDIICILVQTIKIAYVKKICTSDR